MCYVFKKSGAEIGEFLTPLIFLCHSYKKWTLIYCGTIITQNDADLRGKIFYIFKGTHCILAIFAPCCNFLMYSTTSDKSAQDFNLPSSKNRV